MKLIFTAILLLISFSAARAQSAGSVCVEKIVISTDSNVGNPNFNTPRGNKIQIDGKTVFRQSSNVGISGLNLKGNHIVKIFQDKGLVHSFKFNFSQFNSRKLCLFVNDFYGTWQLWETNRRKSCGCK